MEPGMEPLDPLAVKFRRSTRLWQIAAIISCVIAVVMTALFAWQIATRHAAIGCATPPATPTVDSPCPKHPPLLPLPSPLPKRIADALATIDKRLKSMTAKAEDKSAISMNIFYRDSIIMKGHYGSKFYNGSAPPDDNTVYRIGSVTKIFAVILLYKLYEDGLIASLDDPLDKYAPNFLINNPFTVVNISLRQIAGQMSGLPREAPCVYSCSNTNSSQQLDMLKNRNLVMEPWTQPTYSNLGYALLGRLLTENLLNTTFEDWVAKEVFRPLGMINSGFAITDKVKKNMAFPYTSNGKIYKFIYLGWADPAGGMYSTVDDLMKLNVMLTNPAASKANILKQETIREMLLPEFITRDGLWLWGSPWEMRFIRGFVARQKGGNIDSYNAVFSVIPEMQLALNVFVNNVNVFRKGSLVCFYVADFIHDTLLPVLNETLFELRNKAAFPIDAKPFIGTYLVSQIQPLTHREIKYTMVVKQDGDRLLALPTPSPKSGFALMYIGKALLFQAERLQGISGPCFLAHLGVYGMVKFDPPDSEGLSRGFSAPCWKLTGKRITRASHVTLQEKAVFHVAAPFLPATGDFENTYDQSPLI